MSSCQMNDSLNREDTMKVLPLFIGAVLIAGACKSTNSRNELQGEKPVPLGLPVEHPTVKQCSGELTSNRSASLTGRYLIELKFDSVQHHARLTLKNSIVGTYNG